MHTNWPRVVWLKRRAPAQSTVACKQCAVFAREAMAGMMSPEQYRALINHFAGAAGAQQNQRTEQRSKAILRVRDMCVQDFERTAAAWGKWGTGGALFMDSGGFGRAPPHTNFASSGAREPFSSISAGDGVPASELLLVIGALCWPVRGRTWPILLNYGRLGGASRRESCSCFGRFERHPTQRNFACARGPLFITFRLVRALPHRNFAPHRGRARPILQHFGRLGRPHRGILLINGRASHLCAASWPACPGAPTQE